MHRVTEGKAVLILVCRRPKGVADRHAGEAGSQTTGRSLKTSHPAWRRSVGRVFMRHDGPRTGRRNAPCPRGGRSPVHAGRLRRFDRPAVLPPYYSMRLLPSMWCPPYGAGSAVHCAIATSPIWRGWTYDMQRPWSRQPGSLTQCAWPTQGASIKQRALRWAGFRAGSRRRRP